MWIYKNVLCKKELTILIIITKGKYNVKYFKTKRSNSPSELTIDIIKAKYSLTIICCSLSNGLILIIL